MYLSLPGQTVNLSTLTTVEHLLTCIQLGLNQQPWETTIPLDYYQILPAFQHIPPLQNLATKMAPLNWANVSAVRWQDTESKSQPTKETATSITTPPAWGPVVKTTPARTAQTTTTATAAITPRIRWAGEENWTKGQTTTKWQKQRWLFLEQLLLSPIPANKFGLESPKKRNRFRPKRKGRGNPELMMCLAKLIPFLSLAYFQNI